MSKSREVRLPSVYVVGEGSGQGAGNGTGRGSGKASGKGERVASGSGRGECAETETRKELLADALQEALDLLVYLKGANARESLRLRAENLIVAIMSDLQD